MILQLNILIFTGISAAMDLKWWKIKNFWPAVYLAGGLIFDAFCGGNTLASGAAGAAAAFALLILPYAAGGLGAGDVKLFTVCGIWLGIDRILMFMLASFAAAGVWTAVLAIRKRSVKKVLKTKLHAAVFAFAAAVLTAGGLI